MGVLFVLLPFLIALPNNGYDRVASPKKFEGTGVRRGYGVKMREEGDTKKCPWDTSTHWTLPSP